MILWFITDFSLLLIFKKYCIEIPLILTAACFGPHLPQPTCAPHGSLNEVWGSGLGLGSHNSPHGPRPGQLRGEGGMPLPEGQRVVVGEGLALPHQEGPILAPCLRTVFLQQLLGTRPLLHLLVEPLLPKVQLRRGYVLGRKERSF